MRRSRLLALLLAVDAAALAVAVVRARSGGETGTLVLVIVGLPFAYRALRR